MNWTRIRREKEEEGKKEKNIELRNGRSEENVDFGIVCPLTVDR